MKNKEITTVKELIEHLKQFPEDARIVVSCMDGADTIFVKYEEKFNYIMVTG